MGVRTSKLVCGPATLRSFESSCAAIDRVSRPQGGSPSKLKALRDDLTVKLASHSLLIAKDGTERSISDSAVPITKDRG